MNFTKTLSNFACKYSIMELVCCQNMTSHRYSYHGLYLAIRWCTLLILVTPSVLYFVPLACDCYVKKRGNLTTERTTLAFWNRLPYTIIARKPGASCRNDVASLGSYYFNFLITLQGGSPTSLAESKISMH